MLKRAQEKGLATLEALDLRDWAKDGIVRPTTLRTAVDLAW